MRLLLLSTSILTMSGLAAHALSVTTSTDANDFISGLSVGGGVSVVAGSATYVGADNQGGTYSGFSLSNGTDSVNIGDGIVLTSGDATGIVVPSNTDPSFDGILDTPGDADLDNLSGAPTFDASSLSFKISADADVTAVSATFVFATDEFPDQSVPDIFGFFVDGVNYAEFSDGSLINFDLGSISAGFFLDNDVSTSPQFTDSSGNGLQYDGLTSVLTVTGILGTPDADGNHHVKIGIADTDDRVFDSSVFLANFSGESGGGHGGGGITPPAIPLPAGLPLLLAGLGALAVLRRRAA